MAFAEPVAGTEVADPFTGSVAFTAAGTEAPARPLPQGRTLTMGQSVIVPVTITNTSNAPQDYYLDPRLDKTATLTLTPLSYSANQPVQIGTAASALPLSSSNGQSLYFVPSETSSVTVRQTSTVPAMTDLAPAFGDPDAGRRGAVRGLAVRPVGAGQLRAGRRPCDLGRLAARADRVRAVPSSPRRPAPPPTR